MTKPPAPRDRTSGTAGRPEPRHGASVLRSRPARGLPFLLGAAICGVLHAAASLYWTFGGTRLLETVGQFAVDMGREGGTGVRLMLAAITVVKVAGALVPYLDHRRPPPRRWVRILSWVGAGVLLVWGGYGMVLGWVGLAINSPDADRAALWGHAALWDPLFVAWGALLVLGLRASRA